MRVDLERALDPQPQNLVDYDIEKDVERSFLDNIEFGKEHK